MTARPSTGFTVVELLITVAMFGILMAFLVPNLLSARNKAHNVAAAGCAREFLIQGTAYSIDHNGYEGFNGESPYDSRSCTQGVETYHLDTTSKDLLEGRIVSLGEVTFRFSTQNGVTQAR